MAAAIREVNEPRPQTTSRYPIPNEVFEALKKAAPKARLAKKSATLAKDSGKKGEIAALAGAPVALEPGHEPIATPTGSTNFAGISATGWIPPDCTMAAGPQHV